MKLLQISIPKNGGTHIANGLLNNFAEGECLFVDEDTVTLGYFLGNAGQIIRDHRFIGGHIPFHLVQPYAAEFDLIISSYREPWRRAWSAFRFITARAPQWAYLRPNSNADAPEKFSAFIDHYFIANVGTRNMQCGYLGDANLPDSALANIGKHNISMLDCANLNAELAELARRNFLQCDVQAIKNETSARQILMNPGDDPDIDRKLFAWFDGDFALYETLAGRLR